MVHRADNMNEMEENIRVQYSSEDNNLGREMHLFYLSNSGRILFFHLRDCTLEREKHISDRHTHTQIYRQTHRQTDR